MELDVREHRRIDPPGCGAEADEGRVGSCMGRRGGSSSDPCEVGGLHRPLGLCVSSGAGGFGFRADGGAGRIDGARSGPTGRDRAGGSARTSLDRDQTEHCGIEGARLWCDHRLARSQGHRQDRPRDRAGRPDHHRRGGNMDSSGAGGHRQRHWRGGSRRRLRGGRLSAVVERSDVVGHPIGPCESQLRRSGGDPGARRRIRAGELLHPQDDPKLRCAD